MIVSEFIDYLSQLPKGMTIMFDRSPENSSCFSFCDINAIDIVETDIDGEIVLIHDGLFFEDEEDLSHLN